MFFKKYKASSIALILIAALCVVVILIFSFSRFFGPSNTETKDIRYLTRWGSENFELYFIDKDENTDTDRGVLVYKSDSGEQVYNVLIQNGKAAVYARGNSSESEELAVMSYVYGRTTSLSCRLYVKGTYTPSDTDIFPQEINFTLAELYFSEDEMPYRYE